MIAFLQRVSAASVVVDGQTIAAINTGLMVLIGVEKNDGFAQADRLLQRLLGYRVFADPDGKMNLSLTDINGDLLLVPQFTLAADTRKGARPSFTPAAAPKDGERWFDYICEQARVRLSERLSCGRFGADMKVSLTNDGPVSFWLQTKPDG